MATYTDKELLKLRKYLIENASERVASKMVSFKKYYPFDRDKNDYLITVVHVPGLGTVELYFTAMSSMLRINGVAIDQLRVKNLGFEAADKAILKAVDDDKINRSKSWFDSQPD